MSKSKYITQEEFEKISIDELKAKLPRMYKRAMSLNVTRTLNAPSDIYLGDATVCFIMGLPNPCIAMCRATLERILKDKLSIDQETYTDLELMIDDAYTKGILTKTLRDEAISIRKWGVIYIHTKKKRHTEYTKQENIALQVLKFTKKIVEHLYPMQ